ncbi:MAG: TraB/GumN family protein [Gemmatimonadetes bacterium]|nr:TraB/GumN family protein [Gemmatimonadota bacterium]
MTRLRRIVAPAFTAWALSGAGALQAQTAAAPRAAASPATVAGAPARHILWKVTGAHATVYLLGSVHLLTPDAYPLAPAIERAFAAADRVVLEADLDSLQARAPELVLRGRLPEGQTLRAVLSPETYALLEAKLGAYGLPVAMVEGVKPWLLALMLSQLEYQKVGLRPEYGVDMHYARAAREAGKALGALESADVQLGLFDGLSPADQETFLRSTLERLDSTGVDVRRIADAWKAGDAETLESLVNREIAPYPGLAAALLADRNARWVPQIEAMLRGGEDVLVVVGAGHLVGRGGVVALLRAKGYRVERL